jgi:hypothetical protein
MDTSNVTWVPSSCTLPIQERPLRAAELDELIARSLRRQERLSAGLLRWWLDPAAEQAVRELAAKEADCCSFFTFTMAPADGRMRLDIAVPDAHAGILDALADRAAGVAS